MSKKSQVTSNFTVGFDRGTATTSSKTSGDIKLEADSTFNSTKPGSPERFYVFYDKNRIEDIQLISTLGNITYLGKKTLERSEVVSITSTSPVNTQYEIDTLHSIESLGRGYNYSGIDQKEGLLIPKKSSEAIGYILASVVINYTAIGDYYELTHTIPNAHSTNYSIEVMAIGTRK